MNLDYDIVNDKECGNNMITDIAYHVNYFMEFGYFGQVLINNCDISWQYGFVRKMAVI